jgi:hypothetical protein
MLWKIEPLDILRGRSCEYGIMTNADIRALISKEAAHEAYDEAIDDWRSPKAVRKQQRRSETEQRKTREFLLWARKLLESLEASGATKIDYMPQQLRELPNRLKSCAVGVLLSEGLTGNQPKLEITPEMLRNYVKKRFGLQSILKPIDRPGLAIWENIRVRNIQPPGAPLKGKDDESTVRSELREIAHHLGWNPSDFDLLS